MPSNMRSILTTRKKPTPTLTVSISTQVLMCGTLLASTCKSGSAMVIATPSMKLSTMMSPSFFDLVMREPR